MRFLILLLALVPLQSEAEGNTHNFYFDKNKKEDATKAKAEEEKKKADGPYRQARLLLGYAYYTIKTEEKISIFETDPFSRDPFGSTAKVTETKSYGFFASGSYYLRPQIAGTVLLGQISGLEGEFMPFGDPRGAPILKPDGSPFELGVIAGASGITTYNPFDLNTIHVGMRLTTLFDHFGGSLVARTSALSTGDEIRFFQIGIGVAAFL